MRTIETSAALALTLTAYYVAVWFRRKTGLRLVHPSVIALPLLLGVLFWLNLPVGEYQTGSKLLTYLIGPATVGLAVPLYKHRVLIRSQWPVLLGGILTGSLIGVISAMATAAALGLNRNLLLSVAPKSVTAPIALLLSEQLGGVPALTVLVVQSTGVLGSMLGPVLLQVLRIRNRMAWGVALGTAAHGGGTERALDTGELEGAISSLALALNALIAPFLIPPVVRALMAVGERLGVIGP